MKITLSTTIWIALLAYFCSDLQAAELLDVKPVISGSSVSVEITADVPMTYTYYKIPGQARAVIDIAEADPEKVEPLIVVNKGIVSSISVDKAQISGMVVSRLVFNLVAESDITVAAAADHKRLTVTFGHAAATAIPVVKSEPATTSSVPVINDAVAAPGAAALTPAAPAAVTATVAAPPIPVRMPPLKPVVPTDLPPAMATIQSIVIGKDYLDIQTDRTIADYKVISLKKPERLALDLPGAKSALSSKSVVINKFGISTLRIGFYPAHIRIVLDASAASFPKHTITATREGIRISFK
jgi:hypothetical protein